MNPKTTLDGGARIAYISRLLKEPLGKYPGTRKLRRRLRQVLESDKRLRFRLLQPLVMYSGVISHEWGEREVFYPELLMTKRRVLVRGTLHGSNVYLKTVVPSELTDYEVQQLTKAIRGSNGLSGPDYLAVVNPDDSQCEGELWNLNP